MKAGGIVWNHQDIQKQLKPPIHNVQTAFY